VDKASAGALSTAQSRLDALVEAARRCRDRLPESSGADRYTLHAVADVDVLLRRGDGRAELLDGTPVSVETLRRWACDCGLVRHVLKGASEPLDVGRRTRIWSVAQRRAISVRDHGHCRWPACWRRTCDAHHVIHYADGGPTDVRNGCLLCPQHHTCAHEGGFTIIGEANATLIFNRPDGTQVGTS
jgi:hypothetical protein